MATEPYPAALIKELGVGVEPVPPPERPPTLTPRTWCDLALANFWRAWHTWSVVLGQDVLSYKAGTRALTRRSEIEARGALQFAIAWVTAACGIGVLPPGIEDLSGRPLSIRGVITDT